MHPRSSAPHTYVGSRWLPQSCQRHSPLQVWRQVFNLPPAVQGHGAVSQQACGHLEGCVLVFILILVNLLTTPLFLLLDRFSSSLFVPHLLWGSLSPSDCCFGLLTVEIHGLHTLCLRTCLSYVAKQWVSCERSFRCLCAKVPCCPTLSFIHIHT